MTTIRIGIPVYAMVEQGVTAMLDQIYASRKYRILPEDRNCCVRGTVQADARNRTVSESQKIWQTDFDFDYYLSMDADTWYEGDTDKMLDRLIAHRIPVVGAAYPYRDPAMKDFAVAWMWKDRVGNVLPLSITTRGLKRVAGVGHGCCLHHVDVFHRLQYPWYRNVIVQFGGLAAMTDESVGFAIQCGGADISIYCDFDIVCRHENSYQPRTNP
jgi:hypothetical protein